MNNLLGYVLTFFLSIILFITIIKLKLILFKFSHKSKEVQNIHDFFVPPIGGTVIFVCFYFYCFFFNTESQYLYWHILLPAIVIFLLGTLDDLIMVINPKVRLLVIFLCSFFFCLNNESYPSIEIFFIGNLINEYYLIKVFFFSFCITALVNGFNMIDGMNGLSGFTVISSLFCILYINYISSNIFENTNIIILIILFFSFLIFNFPWGKIFLGDAGCYWIGWIIGITLIIGFETPSLNTWSILIIIFYPTMEVIFSTLRKLIQKKDPTKPDLDHLHLKLFFLLKGEKKINQKFNSFITLCLMPIWISPLLLIQWVLIYPFLSLIFLFLLLIIYLSYYFVIPKLK